jgi:hypothetical protein
MTQKHRRRIDIIQSPEFIGDLSSVGTDELRRRRTLCGDLDTELSFYRRLLHGRMDLLSFEMRRRSGEEERSLLEALPEILASGGGSGPGLGLRQLDFEMPDIPERGQRAVDRVLADDFLARLPEMVDDELLEIQQRLTEVEMEVSRQRRAVYEAYDRVQAELTSRYRGGLTEGGGETEG